MIDVDVVTVIDPPIKLQESGRSHWGSTWFDHQSFRDERVEAFASLLHPVRNNFV